MIFFIHIYVAGISKQQHAVFTGPWTFMLKTTPALCYVPTIFGKRHKPSWPPSHDSYF